MTPFIQTQQKRRDDSELPYQSQGLVQGVINRSDSPVCGLVVLSMLYPPKIHSEELYTAIKGPFGTTKNLHPFPEIDVTERFPDDWAASSPAGLCTGDNSALLAFRAPQHDFWGGSGDLELLTVDGSLLDGSITIEEVKVIWVSICCGFL